MRKRRKLLWQLYPTYLVITLISLVGMTWYASHAVKEYSIRHTIAMLTSQAQLVKEIVKGKIVPENSKLIDELCKNLGFKISSRITIILPSGTVLGDTRAKPSRMDDHSNRPEVIAALSGQIGTSIRYSATLRREMVYVAIPVTENGNVSGLIRTSMPVAKLTETLKSIYLNLAIGVIVIAVFAAAISLYVSHRINRPIAALKEGAMAFADGKLNYKLDVPDSDEIGGLAIAMNAMAAEINSRIEMIKRQKNETEAVLSAMVEAVLVVNAEEKLIKVNKAAEKLFKIQADILQGRSLQEVVRNTDLNRFVSRTFSSNGPVEGEIVVIGVQNKYLQAHGTQLTDKDGKQAGALVVLNDVTRLKKVDNIRKDFVASVSHELKTPITSIQGFLETLLEGAIHDSDNAERFLKIIIKHTDRLSAIIEELLSLSRIELESERGGIELNEDSVESVLKDVAKACDGKAKEKGLILTFECQDGLMAQINATLLEQAIINLVDNSIKFTDEGGNVTISAKQIGNEIVINVADDGCGVPREHQDRIFERFYRVDKARSSDQGGTGLGLAIVRHIVNAHRGKVELQSSPGIGSTFSIHLPKN